jgi:hypothetical protein
MVRRAHLAYLRRSALGIIRAPPRSGERIAA